MDMANATASGPSYGLFDVLFGSGAKEEAGDGQEFGPMMDIIKALNKGKEELSQGISRTDKGTGTAAGGSESPAVGATVGDVMAAELAQSKLDAEQRDRELRERMSALFGIGALQAQAPKLNLVKEPEGAEGLEMLSAQDINRALKEKNLPGLNAAEQKLLEAVNGKLEQANLQGPAVQEDARLASLQKELAAKRINPSDIKGGEAQGATPEKMLSTETYLKMHEAFGKGQAKDAAALKRDAVDSTDAPAQGTAAAQNLMKNAIAESGGKGQQDLLGNAHRQVLEKPGEGLKSDAKGPAGAFAEMMQSLKGESKLDTKDVFLPGTKPEQMRPILMSEVQHGVNLNAVKGGGEMRLVVHPPEMGEVHLKVGTKEGKVEVSVTAENSQVADMIRDGSKDLENSLQDKNLTLAKFEVSVSDQLNVASSDTKSNLSDQFLGQNQNGFSQGLGRDDSSSARRESDFGQQGQQSGGFRSMNDDASGSSASRAKSTAARAPSRSSAGRLDVVA